MNGFRLVYRAILAGSLGALCSTGFADTDMVAVVKNVTGGICESCPYNRFEKRSVLVKNAMLRATDEVRCQDYAQATAHFIVEGGGDFVITGSSWRVVGFAGLPGQPNKLTPLFGYEAQNFSIDRPESQEPPMQTIVSAFFPLATSNDLTLVTGDSTIAELVKTPASREKDFEQTLVALPSNFVDYYEAYMDADNWSRHMFKMALLQNNIPSGGIRVNSNSGVVTLKGKVPEPEQKTRAGEVAKDIWGVDAVNNQLQLYGVKE